MKNGGSAKDTLFETAARLFYEQGYRATGVDTIAAASGIGKMTLYRHYPSKDDLIVAYLERTDREFWEHWEASTAEADTPRDKLIAFFASLQRYVTTSACHGCALLNVTSEYPEPDYPGHQVALRHKRDVRARFLELATEAGAREPEILANTLVLLMDGAYMAARVFGASPDSPAANLAEAARQAMIAQCGEDS